MSDAEGYSEGAPEPMLGNVVATQAGLEWLRHEASEVERMQWAHGVLQGATTSTLSEKLLRGGVPAALVTEFIGEIFQWDQLAKERLPALVIGACLRMALAMPDDPMPEIELGVGKMPNSPRFPTGISKLDTLLDGGLYGVAAISGAPKVGKSMFAMAVALEAMRDGWLVIYANAEMTRATLTNRLLALCGGWIPIDLNESLIFYTVQRGITLAALENRIRNSLNLDTQKLLVVLDSINTVAEMSITSSGDANYWNALRDLGHLAMASRKSSEGKCSWLLVSEQNARGELKGLKLQYTADVVVSMKAAEAEGQVEISVPYARESRSGDVGRFMRKITNGRFEPC